MPVYHTWVTPMDFKADSALSLISLNLPTPFSSSVPQGLLVVFLLPNNRVNIWYTMGFPLGWLTLISCSGAGLMTTLSDGCWHDNSKGAINASAVAFTARRWRDVFIDMYAI